MQAGRPSLFLSPDFLAPRQPPSSPRKTRACPPRSSPPRPLRSPARGASLPGRSAGGSPFSFPPPEWAGWRRHSSARPPGRLPRLPPACRQNARVKRAEGVSDVRAPTMVWVSRALLRKYGSFIDDLRIYVKGGAGGMGHPRYGGEGGKGGDVWLVADGRVTLKKLKQKYPQKRFVAGNGAHSSVAALKGSKGKDCEVNVPPGISVVTDDGKLFGELYKEGDRLLVAHGGLGGCLVSNFFPTKGQKHLIHLDLKLIADVGLVGFPNAGKSSLLSKISHATPRIADYAFTTVQPELGTIEYPDFKKITVADLPGLIEGAHKNKGHGHKFLKHVERTKQLLFVVDVSGFQLSSRTPFRTAFQTVVLLARELELYKEELRAKPALLAVNKMDLPNAQELLDKFMEQLQKPEDYTHSLSAEMIPDVLVKFKEIIPISAHTGEGLEKLIPCIRKVIDEEGEKEIENYHKQQLHKLRSQIQ